MSHRFVARATLGAGSGGRPDAHARSSSGGSWVSGSPRPRSLSYGHQAIASDVPLWTRGDPKRRRLDPGAGSSRGAGSSPLLLSQGAGPRGVGVPQRLPALVADGSRHLSDSFPPLDTVAGRSRLSLRISKAISCFARYPHGRPAGLSASENGCLDIDQVWLHWKRHQGVSRQQLLQCITAHAFGSEGHRRFLLRSDEDGHTWVSVAESLRGLKRRHRRRRANTGSGDVAVISSDSPLPDPSGDVSADQELHVAASCPDTPKPVEPSFPVIGSCSARPDHSMLFRNSACVLFDGQSLTLSFPPELLMSSVMVHLGNRAENGMEARLCKEFFSQTAKFY